MLTLTNSDHLLSILAESLVFADPDLEFVTDDGSYSTHKIIIFSLFPSLSSFLCMACTSSHCPVKVFVPGVKTEMVEEAVKKICQEGDVARMENILGIPADEIQGRGIGRFEEYTSNSENLVNSKGLKEEFHLREGFKKNYYYFHGIFHGGVPN